MMRKQYTPAFKAKVVQELLKEEKTFTQLASEYKVHPTQLTEWDTIPLDMSIRSQEEIEPLPHLPQL